MSKAIAASPPKKPNLPNPRFPFRQAHMGSDPLAHLGSDPLAAKVREQAIRAHHTLTPGSDPNTRGLTPNSVEGDS